MLNHSNQNLAIVLAAGLSTRMGVCKTTLPWYDGKTLLRYQAEQFLLAGITPIIVLGSHNAYRRSDCPPGSRIAINFNSRSSKTSSILAGLELLPAEFSSVIISAVDQPRTFDIYQRLLYIYHQRQSAIVAPCFNRKLGHPLLFSDSLLSELKNISDSNLGLREIINRLYSQIEKVDFKTPEILLDINNQDTYSSVLEKKQITMIEKYLVS